MPERKGNATNTAGHSGGNVVLFQRSTGGNGQSAGDMWDDTELIAAWNRQLDRGTSLDADPVPLVPLDAGEDEEEEEEDEEDPDEEGSTCIRGAVGGSMPPLPAGVSARVGDMLRAWYAAGVTTGMYLAEEEAKKKSVQDRKRPRE